MQIFKMLSIDNPVFYSPCMYNVQRTVQYINLYYVVERKGQNINLTIYSVQYQYSSVQSVLHKVVHID